MTCSHCWIIPWWLNKFKQKQTPYFFRVLYIVHVPHSKITTCWLVPCCFHSPIFHFIYVIPLNRTKWSTVAMNKIPIDDCLRFIGHSEYSFATLNYRMVRKILAADAMAASKSSTSWFQSSFTSRMSRRSRMSFLRAWKFLSSSAGSLGKSNNYQPTETID